MMSAEVLVKDMIVAQHKNLTLVDYGCAYSIEYCDRDGKAITLLAGEDKEELQGIFDGCVKVESVLSSLIDQIKPKD